MRIRISKRGQGFTLIEIMFALAMFGMIVAVIYSSWAVIVRGSKTGLEAAAAVQRSRMAMRTLENALTCTCSYAGDIEYYAFLAENGDDASLSFVAHLPDSFPRGGKFGGYNTRRVTFSLEPGADSGKRFVLRQSPVLMDLDQDEKEYPVVLARNVKEFSMEFWDKTAKEWVDEWTQTNQLPLLVKVTMQFGGKDPYGPPRDEVTRIISLPSSMVQSAWQMPGYRGGPPNPNRSLVIPSPGGVR